LARYPNQLFILHRPQKQHNYFSKANFIFVDDFRVWLHTLVHKYGCSNILLESKLLNMTTSRWGGFRTSWKI